MSEFRLTYADALRARVYDSRDDAYRVQQYSIEYCWRVARLARGARRSAESHPPTHPPLSPETAVDGAWTLEIRSALVPLFSEKQEFQLYN